MKILITGSTGFLGKVLVRLINKKRNNLYFITRKKNKKKNNFCCNLENLKKVQYVINLIKPDVVINLAAKINFIIKMKKMYKLNSLAPKIFAEYCKKNNQSKLDQIVQNCNFFKTKSFSNSLKIIKCK